VAADEIVGVEEYRNLLADARAMVTALCGEDVTRTPVPEGNPPLQAAEVEVFDQWRARAVENWNLVGESLAAGDPTLLRARLYILQGDLTYPLSDVRSDWEVLAPKWAASFNKFADQLQALQDKTAVGDRPGAREQVAAFLPALAAEFQPVPSC
jgi:hypothetical protein